MDIKINTVKNGIGIVHLNGKLNIESENEFELKINKLFSENITKILLNMSEVKHIDSTGLGSIMKIMNRAKFSNIELYLFDLPDNIKNVFSVAYIDIFFNIRSSEEIREIFPGIKL